MSGIRPPGEGSGEVFFSPGGTRSRFGGAGPHDPDFEARVAKIESDVGHIRSDVGEIKSLLGRLAPRIDEMYGRQTSMVTQQDFSSLRVEVSQRPTRRQTIFDIFGIVTLIGAVLAIGTKFAH
jgi:hypothetical protein